MLENRGVRETNATVAILAANPALSSILTAVLAAAPNLRVRQFDSRSALQAYMRIAPVDLLVSDFDCEEARPDRLARELRHDVKLERRDFQIIALARTLTPETTRASVSSGIDEVIVKPMSPRYLLERVVARLTGSSPRIATTSGYHGRERRDRASIPPASPRSFSRKDDNVIPLFGRDNGPPERVN